MRIMIKIKSLDDQNKKNKKESQTLKGYSWGSLRSLNSKLEDD